MPRIIIFAKRKRKRKKKEAKKPVARGRAADPPRKLSQCLNQLSQLDFIARI
jgi:hypothetical protein